MRLIKTIIVVAGLMLMATVATAKDNFCAECHTTGELSSFTGVMEWDSSIHQLKGETLCPGVLELRKEAYFTESRLARYDEFLSHLEHQTRRWPENMRQDLVKQGIAYAELKNLPVASIGSVAGANLKIKKGMHAVYEKLNKLRGDYSMERVFGYMLLGTVFIMLMLVLGLKNTLKE